MPENNKTPATDHEAHTRNALSERALRLGRRGIFFALLILAALAVLIVWLLAGKKDANSAEESEEVVVSVQVAKAERQPIAQEVTALGIIFPLKEATVSAKVAKNTHSMIPWWRSAMSSVRR